MTQINVYLPCSSQLCQKKNMKFQTAELLADLIARTEQNIKDVQLLQQQSVDRLNKKASPDSWSALEAIEHLNLYSDFYMPEIKKCITESKFSRPSKEFKSGVLGNYFANSVADKPKLNKMKTFVDKNPNGSELGVDVLEKFLDYQKTTLELLDTSRKVDLKKTRTAISISKTLKLRLGDTCRVVIYHNQRHISQAKRAVV